MARDNFILRLLREVVVVGLKGVEGVCAHLERLVLDVFREGGQSANHPVNGVLQGRRVSLLDALLEGRLDPAV